MLCMVVNLERYSPPTDCASSDKEPKKTMLLSKMFPSFEARGSWIDGAWPWRVSPFGSILDCCRSPSELMT
jgi:hypothetical protein